MWDFSTALWGLTNCCRPPSHGRTLVDIAAGLPRQHGLHDAADAGCVSAPLLQTPRGTLHEHGAKDDLMESRRAFAEKRKPNFKGWKDPADRHRLPKLDEPGASVTG